MKSEVFFLIFGLFVSSRAEIIDLDEADYARMPDLFTLDEYEPCMRKSDGVYCLLTLELDAEPNNELYMQIKEYSDNYIRHFNHTLLDRGICVSKTCTTYSKHKEYTEEDLKLILRECLNESFWNEYKLGAKIHKLHYCNKSTEVIETSYLDWIASAVLIVILLMNIIGTIYYLTVHKHNPEDNPSKFLVSFSIIKNWKDLFRKGTEKYENVSIKGLNGLRVIGILNVILAHVIVGIVAFAENTHDFEKINQKPYYKIFMYGLPIVQIFFAMSGFLQSYIICNFEKNSNFVWRDIPKLILFRLIRLAPSYAVVMLLSITWLQYWGFGPLWSLYVGGLSRDCGKFFWHHLFFINNYMSEDVQCSVPLWHLAADMQLFVLGLFVLVFTKERRMLVLSILFVLGLVGPMLDVWLKGVEPVTVITPDFSHIRGHNNLPCFVAGMIGGIFVHKYQIRGVTLRNKLLYANTSYPSLISKLIFAAVYRIVLSGVLGSLILALSMKFDSTVYRLLAWSGWEVPSRLSYSVFLIHMLVIIQLVGAKTSTAHVSTLHFVTTYLGVTVLSFILGIVLYVLVEAPCNKLLKESSMVAEYLNKQDKRDD